MLTCTSCVRRAEILSGVGLSQEIRRRVAAEARVMSRPPCLAVVLVGERADSLRYVRHKAKAAEDCGIEFRFIHLPATISQQRLQRELVAVNSDHGVDGVLLQLPLPPHLRARQALFHIHPGKDVDGLHPLNAGNLFLRDLSPLAESTTTTLKSEKASGMSPLVDDSIVVATNEGSFSSITRQSHESRYFIPCTALAVRSLILSYLNRTESFFQPSGTKRSGSGCSAPRRDMHAVIVNTSMVVGVPTAALLQKEPGFTVTMCNRGSSLEMIRQLMRTADVVVTAYGQANVFDASFVKEGAIVVDVAVNEHPPSVAAATTGEKPTSTLCGDVDFASVQDVARAITPVPGGVGPLTVAHLMQNALKAARLRQGRRLIYNNIYTSFISMYGSADGASGRRQGASTVDGSGDACAAAAVAAAGLVNAGSSREAASVNTAHDANGGDDDDEELAQDFTDNGSFDC